MSVKKQPVEMPQVFFSWADPITSVVEARVLPNGLSTPELCHYLRLSRSTILRLRRFRGFPNPRGPNPRRIYYSKTEVLLWLLKDCGVLEEWETEYIDKKNNIYLSLYSNAQDCVTLRQDASDCSSLRQDAPDCASLRHEPLVSEREFKKILLTYGFDMHYFEKHLKELLPMFEEKRMDYDVIDKICYDVQTREDLDAAHQDALLLAYLRNHKTAKKRQSKKSIKKEGPSVEFTSIDYGSMIEELNDYE